MTVQVRFNVKDARTTDEAASRYRSQNAGARWTILKGQVQGLVAGATSSLVPVALGVIP